MTNELVLELKRKLFHLLNLVYLAAYHWLGASRALWLLAAWIVLEGVIEVVRLKYPPFNRLLMSHFGGIHRESEETKISGIFWTAMGCWWTFFLFGGRPELVVAAICYLAFGDMVAALAGKSLGRIPIGLFGRNKTLEGSLACFAACVAVGVLSGLRAPAILAGAAAAAVLELAPLPIDDNLWLPLGSALVLSFF